MKSKKYTTFDIEGKKYVFSTVNFKQAFDSFKSVQKLKVQDLEEVIADKTGVTKESVHNWRFYCNGPSTLEQIKLIASCLSIKDYKLLMKEDTKMEDKKFFDIMQIDAARRIFVEIISFLHEFFDTDGFNNYWFEISDKLKKDGHDYDSDFVLNELENFVDKKYRRIILAYEKEYILLKNHPIYDEIENLLYSENGLQDCYIGKLSFAYRIEAPVKNVNGEQSGVTTYEDYEIAINKVRSVFDKYF